MSISSTSGAELRVLSPRAERTRTASAGAASLGELRGKRIGILNNTKSGGDLLLPYVLDAIKARVPEVEFREWRIPFQLDPRLKAPRLEELAHYSDGVIALTGD